jgi:DhnA family fructose-bisphosphate aldolase class Ia
MDRSGKERRLRKLIDPGSGRVVAVPLDDSLLAGPIGELRDLGLKVRQVTSGRPNTVIGFKGLFLRYAKDLIDIPIIFNVTASTTRSQHTRKVRVTSVMEAMTLGADAVAVHVNIGSNFESEMLRLLGHVSDQCSRLGMPLLAIMYPRREAESGDDNFLDLRDKEPERYAELVCHAARVGVELGADLIKTQYTHNTETFKWVIESCGTVPVLVAGGPLTTAREMLGNAAAAVAAGAKGVSFGRNVFLRSDSGRVIQALSQVVHQGQDPEKAAAALGNDT